MTEDSPENGIGGVDRDNQPGDDDSHSTRAKSSESQKSLGAHPHYGGKNLGGLQQLLQGHLQKSEVESSSSEQDVGPRRRPYGGLTVAGARRKKTSSSNIDEDDDEEGSEDDEVTSSESVTDDCTSDEDELTDENDVAEDQQREILLDDSTEAQPVDNDWNWRDPGESRVQHRLDMMLTGENVEIADGTTYVGD